MGADNSTPNKQNQREDQDRAIAAALERQRRLYDEKYEELRRAQKQSVKVILSELKKSSNESQTPNKNVSQQPVTQLSAPLYPNLNHIANNNAQMSTTYPSPANNNDQTSTAYLSPAYNNAQVSTAHPSPAINNAQMSTAHPSPAINNAQMLKTFASPNYNNAQMSTANASLRTSHYQRPSNTILSQVQPTAPSAPIDPALEALHTATQSVSQPRQAVPGSSQSHKQHLITQRTPAVPSTSSAITAQSVNLPHSSSSQSHKQHPIAQATPAVPSTSSAITAQSGNLPHPKPKARNVPHNKASPSIVPCVTCKEELGLQIFQCENGHSSCRECKLKQIRCGVCRGPITDMRNITLEITIADIKLKELKNEDKIKCPNAADGCCLSVKKHEVESHLKECPYREMACPLTAIFGICTWKGKINQIGMHFKDVHPQHYEADVDKEMYLPHINVNDRIVHLINLNPLHFVVYIEINRDLETICMTVQTLGTKVSASKWTYELHVYNKREPRRKYHYIDMCSSNSESVKDIIMQQKCAVLSLRYAKTFLDDNNQLTYKIYIKKNLNPRKNQLK